MSPADAQAIAAASSGTTAGALSQAASATPASVAAQSAQPFSWSALAKSAGAVGAGSSIGSLFAPSNSTSQTIYPASTTPYTQPASDFNQAYFHNGQASTPGFNNYNPIASVAGPNPGYNFYGANNGGVM
jgi:hypothetical protein